MAIRHAGFAALMLGTVGVPYAVSSWNRPTASLPVTTPAAAASTAAAGAAVSAPAYTGPSLGGQVGNVAEVFRFDVTPAWVMGNWPRVSAGLAEIDLQGYRVPLSTGPRQADVAGSLTYYFNRQQQVERITFQGTTGDARELLAWLTSAHGFQQVKAGGPHQYVYRVQERGRVLSELVITPSRVVRMDSPHARFDVSLSMRRPKA